MDLKLFLKSNDMTIASLSRKSGVPYSTVSEIVNGKKSMGKCNAETVYMLAQALDATMENLLLCSCDGDFSNRYSLDRRQSLFLAKRLWDENVYCGMKMENRNVTFPQTRTILDGVNVPEVVLEDIMAIRNMRDAWKFLMDSVGDKLDLDYICKLNSFIARDEALEWGVLRTGSVGISGTDYRPAAPVRSEVEKGIDDIVHSFKSVTERALDLFCFITYHQLFWDGNKRTALTSANKLLVGAGCGILTIKDRDMEEFNTLLRQMYETGKNGTLKHFLYEKAITGIEFKS